MNAKEYKTFQQFYPYYLTEHCNSVCRTLHFIGTTLVMGTLLVFLTIRAYHLLWVPPLIGYSFAWVGHFVFEKNRPATFKYPWYSLKADFVMSWQLLTGKLNF
ncbi:MAG: Mpo1-like protein [Bacteriovoracaceae bacterium]